jgi:hypothetical protein
MHKGVQLLQCDGWSRPEIYRSINRLIDISLIHISTKPSNHSPPPTAPIPQVSIDDVIEKIEAMEDHVQSVDISSFNKL